MYPKLKLTLYPLSKINDSSYSIDLDGIDKHFADILELNDKVYKSKFLLVNFGHLPDNFNQELLVTKIIELLEKSLILEEVYFEELPGGTK